jgi:hypothetical protein
VFTVGERRCDLRGYFAMSAVDWILSSQDDVHVGDVISSDAGGMPTYRVMVVDHDEAVLEDEHHGAVRAPLNRFPWKAAGRA